MYNAVAQSLDRVLTLILGGIYSDRPTTMMAGELFVPFLCPLHDLDLIVEPGGMPLSPTLAGLIILASAHCDGCSSSS
jgi:hypothetical protein